MAPFYGWGSTASRLEPLRGGSLLFTTSAQWNRKVGRGNKDFKKEGKLVQGVDALRWGGGGGGWNPLPNYERFLV